MAWSLKPTTTIRHEVIQQWDRDTVIETVMPRLAELEDEMRKKFTEWQRERFNLHLEFRKIGLDMDAVEKRIKKLESKV